GSASVSGLTITSGYLQSGEGAGVLNNGGHLTLTDVVVSDNDVGGRQNIGYGGGLADINSNTPLTDCTLRGQGGGGNGGGLYNNNSNTTLTNCPVIGNYSQTGGGLYTSGYYASYTLGLTNCTVTGNSAVTRGGGLSINQTKVTLTNCIVGGNSVEGPNRQYDDIDGDFIYGGPNLIGSGSVLSSSGD